MEYVSAYVGEKAEGRVTPRQRLTYTAQRSVASVLVSELWRVTLTWFLTEGKDCGQW